MTQKDKELLLKDLCARLPYRVNVKTTGDNESYTLLSINWNKNIALIGLKFGDVYATSKIKIDEVKPYLRPMSSMTLKELEEYRHFSDHIRDAECKIHIANYNQIDWLNAHYFDYRTDDEGKTMIEKGLAIEAPEGIYDNKEE